MSVALVMQHAKRMRHVVICGLSACLYHFFFTLSDKRYDFWKLGVIRWGAKALDTEEWASIIREAKAKMKGP